MQSWVFKTWIPSIVALLSYFREYWLNLSTLTRQIMPVDPSFKMKAKFFTKIGHLLIGRQVQPGGS